MWGSFLADVTSLHQVDIKLASTLLRLVLLLAVVSTQFGDNVYLLVFVLLQRSLTPQAT